MDERLVDVWINCPDHEAAERIGARLIEERLAACANILAPIASLYRWKGRIESDEEVPLVLKTRSSLFGELCAAARALHPFEVPSIVAMEIALVDPEYGQWVLDETRAPAQSRR